MLPVVRSPALDCGRVLVALLHLVLEGLQLDVELSELLLFHQELLLPVLHLVDPFLILGRLRGVELLGAEPDLAFFELDRLVLLEEIFLPGVDRRALPLQPGLEFCEFLRLRIELTLGSGDLDGDSLELLVALHQGGFPLADFLAAPLDPRFDAGEVVLLELQLFNAGVDFGLHSGHLFLIVCEGLFFLRQVRLEALELGRLGLRFRDLPVELATVRLDDRLLLVEPLLAELEGLLELPQRSLELDEFHVARRQDFPLRGGGRGGDDMEHGPADLRGKRHNGVEKHGE